jgi:hypothetical protein
MAIEILQNRSLINRLLTIKMKTDLHDWHTNTVDNYRGVENRDSRVS